MGILTKEITMDITWILLLLFIALPQGTVLAIQVQSCWKSLAGRLPTSGIRNVFFFFFFLFLSSLIYYMDTKYHNAANVASSCKANPNADSLMKNKSDWGNQQHP